MKSQWDCFLQNLGCWQGSFTTFSPEGVFQEDIPSRLTLEQGESGVDLTLKRDSPKHPEPLRMNFSSLSRGLLFFETGAFSQGSMQLTTYGQFGGEFGLVTPDRRLRMVQMFEGMNGVSNLKQVTLIREQRLGSDVPERPKLSVDDLVGTWQGEAVTLYPDWRADHYPMEMRLERVGDRLDQQITFGDRKIETSADIEGDRLMYRRSRLPVQILLLPDGASANAPLAITPGLPFVLEMGWLVEPNVRQRIMRTYDAKGEWVNVTLSVERRVIN